MRAFLQGYFRITEAQSTFRREVLAGLTTFLTMSYIVIVNPAILEAAGIPKRPSTVATILTAALGTLLMGVYARRPFAIAPYMGENAFIAYTVVGVLGYSWQTALGAVFIGGVLFVLLTLLGLRAWLVEAVPLSLKYAFAGGIGLFLTLIGLVTTGLVRLGVPAAPVQVGIVTQSTVLLAVLGFLGISVLLARRVRGAMLYGILGTTVLGYLSGVTPLPTRFVSPPPDLGGIALQLDLAGALTWGFVAVILTVFVMDFLDTMATLIGLGARAGFLDDRGNLPDIDKPMLADALATVAGALLGTTTAGTFIESAAGIETGGRTGLTAVTTAVLFLLCLFLAPFLTSIPAYAYGPALIVVGCLMLSVLQHLPFDDLTELVPAFVTLTLMAFTYNLGIGITAGFVVYPLMKLSTGRAREIHPGMWGLSLLSLLFYLIYPYA